MPTRFVCFLLVALGGADLILQMVWNARLRTATGSLVLATSRFIFVSLCALSWLWASGMIPCGSVSAFKSLPTWGWLGGIFAAYYFAVSLVAIPKSGRGICAGGGFKIDVASLGKPH